MGQPLPPKKDVVLALLERATVFIHVDPRRQGCVVPMNFKQQPQLVLQIGLNMAVPIPDLRIEDTGITCTLSFGGRGFWCSMPWSCVYAMVGEDGRGMVWPDDLPPEVRATAKPQEAPKQGAPKPVAKVEDEPKKKPRAKKQAEAKSAEAKPKKKSKQKDTTEAVEKPKRAKKKAPAQPEPTGDIRRRLVAVQPKKQEPEPAPSPQEMLEAQVDRRAPETPPPAGQRKPKRELPPYLRVVK